MKITFVINKYRKGNVNNKFNPKLSSYWQMMMDKELRKWRGK